MPARLGGDEFAVLIRDCTASEAARTAGDIVHAIGNIEFRWDTQLFRIGASIGATMITDASTCLEDLLNEADQACYRAKNSGRGQVHIHDPKRKSVARGSDPHPRSGSTSTSRRNVRGSRIADRWPRGRLGILLRRHLLAQIRLVLCRNGIVAAEPAIEIDIGATRRAERMVFLLRGLAAKRAGTPGPQAHRMLLVLIRR